MTAAPTGEGRRVVVVGTGAFATSVISGLVAACRIPLHVTVVGRTPTAIARLERAVRAEVDGAPAASLHTCETPLALGVDLTATLADLRPDLVVVCASLHSPYPPTDRDDAWTALVAECEFGLTGLLQAALTVPVAQALIEIGGIPLVNACYPDFVNPLLAALGLPVLCGLGNVHTIATGLADQLPSLGTGPKVLAHHRHLKDEPTGDEDVRVWWPGASEAEVAAALHDLRRWPRRQLNDFGAQAGGRLVARLLSGAAGERTSLPGPGGLPGGYPVRVGLGGCELDLPDEVTVEEAVSWNQGHARAEGIRVHEGRIEVSGRAGQALQRLGVVPGPSIDVEEWQDAAHRLLEVREAPTR